MKDLSLQAMSAEKWKSLRNERVNQKNFDSSAAAHVMHEEGSETLKKQIGKILLCGAVFRSGEPDTRQGATPPFTHGPADWGGREECFT
ncbi:MAG: hypothetical protein MRZ28_02685 [Oscillospiraceae bacterium]|jgi:hypothetical protein|nr:hypothetical protein [Oscillospiraceae bacterium]MCM0705336.1 hypothetical protein [Faecalicatena sp. BF-R-105]MDY3217828.1 hypothetical protein [Candidatus Fimivivens sp.]